MLPAFLCTLLFSVSAISANRSVAHLGSNLANVSRLTLACLIMGIVAWIIGVWPGWTVWTIFFISGIVGFGFGDIGVFYALPRLGSRLTILYTQCIAAPIAGIVEWIWLGTSLSMAQIICAVVTLSGVAIALDPWHTRNLKKDKLISGSLFGLLAAAGQGMGAVISRYGYDTAHSAGVELPAMTAAFFRIIGGLLIAWAAWGIGNWFIRRKRSAAFDKSEINEPTLLKWKASHVKTFVLINALTGPVLGVACFQWALGVRPSFVVLPIVALSPIVAIPLTRIWENDRPSLVSLIGAVISVVGAAALSLVTILP